MASDWRDFQDMQRGLHKGSEEVLLLPRVAPAQHAEQPHAMQVGLATVS